MNLNQAEIISKNDVPDRRNTIDYRPLFRKVAAMVNKDDAIRIPIEKGHYVSNIQNALDKEFKKGRYKVFQRTIKKKLYAIIVDSRQSA